jgi:hypothetical protein
MPRRVFLNAERAGVVIARVLVVLVVLVGGGGRAPPGRCPGRRSCFPTGNVRDRSIRGGTAQKRASRAVMDLLPGSPRHASCDHRSATREGGPTPSKKGKMLDYIITHINIC